MWRQLKPKNTKQPIQSKKMQEMMKLEEEKKRMVTLKLREQAEERERRAGMRENSSIESRKGLETGEHIKTPDPTLTQPTLPTDVQGSTQSTETVDHPDHSGNGGHDRVDPVIVDLCEEEDERSDSSGGEDDGDKKKRGKLSVVKKKKKTKCKKGKNKKSRSPTPIREDGVRNGNSMYGGLIEADQRTFTV
ncbi:hypothetical protein DFH28DRAFT_921365 [Melampsora americana]|nr:hypothetical protein DFH28DRAFT_921365 [Melampsora americana]